MQGNVLNKNLHDTQLAAIYWICNYRNAAYYIDEPTLHATFWKNKQGTCIAYYIW